MRLRFKSRIRVAARLAWIGRISLILLALVPVSLAQTAVTGGLNGVVKDSTGAVVPGATVTIVNTATGDTRVLTTNAAGRYSAPFLKPGAYKVSAAAQGLESSTTSAEILVSQQSAANLTVSPSGSKQTVTVNANNAQLIDTQTANLTTTFTTQQFENLPNPGGDITTFAFTVPGVVVNTNGAHGSYNGNFSSNGLPGISNLMVLNGADQTDSFFNDATTGVSTLSIGAAEIAQASLVQNGYSTEWGRQAGAVQTYVTKSGTNRVHGLLNWTYNSDGLNANDFFNNLSGTPRQKAISNQYAAQIGGPIIHNKLFFFADTEGYSLHPALHQLCQLSHRRLSEHCPEHRSCNQRPAVYADVQFVANLAVLQHCGAGHHRQRAAAGRIRSFGLRQLCRYPSIGVARALLRNRYPLHDRRAGRDTRHSV